MRVNSKCAHQARPPLEAMLPAASSSGDSDRLPPIGIVERRDTRERHQMWSIKAHLTL
jgi:hypothetical protein